MWTKEYEVTTYWDKVVNSIELTKKYFNDFENDVEHFNLKFIDANVNKVVDVGAGAFGGIFNIINLGQRKIIVDPLANDFKERYGRIREDIECIDGYCHALPLESDDIDVLFCIETLDHCSNIEELYKSLHEMKRVVKKGGLVYFMMPVRPQAVEGHPLHGGIVHPEEIKGIFRDWNILEWEFECNHIFLTAQR